jgi:hypothetical protein
MLPALARLMIAATQTGRLDRSAEIEFNHR